MSAKKKKVKVYLIASPIGDVLGDFCVSALEIIKRLEHLFVEDIEVDSEGELTSRMKKRRIITSKHKLHKIVHGAKTVRYFPLIDELIEQRTSFAVLSDRGLPCFLDPGLEITQYLFSKYSDEVELVPLGISSALDGAIVLSGVDCTNFMFLGHYPEQYCLDVDFSSSKMPVIFYVRGDSLVPFVEEVRAKIGVADGSFKIAVFANIRQRQNSKIRHFSLDEPLSDFESFDSPEPRAGQHIYQNNYTVMVYRRGSS
jgi:hypothetical protein